MSMENLPDSWAFVAYSCSKQRNFVVRSRKARSRYGYHSLTGAKEDVFAANADYQDQSHRR